MSKALLDNIMHSDNTDEGSDDRHESSSGTQDEESPSQRLCDPTAQCAVSAIVHLESSSREPGIVSIQLSGDDIHHSKRSSAAISAVSDSVECNLANESAFMLSASWRGELKTMLTLCWPLILTNTSTCIMVVTDQIFVGHLGVAEFAAAALANTWFNLLWSFMLGASTAMDTLASQAYGARDYRSLCVWTFAGLISMTLLCFPIMAALYLAGDVAAVVFRQGHGEVSSLVAQFCHALIPGMWPLAWSLILMKFLQTQNCMLLPACIIGFTCVANIGLNAALVLNLGFDGAAWPTTLSRTLQAILMAVACVWAQAGALRKAGVTFKEWRPVAWAALKTACHPKILWAYCRIALPGGAMNAFEAGAFDITTAFAGALGETPVAAHAALLSICIFCFNALPFAVSIAGTIRVGNLLGAGRPKQARLAGILCIVIGAGFQALCGIVIGASDGQVTRVFTSDTTVLDTVRTVALLAMAFQFSDGVFGTAQGVLRGMGLQTACVYINALGFWVGGVVIGYLAAFQGALGLRGLWVGLLCGDFSAMALSAVWLSRVSWKREAVKAHSAVVEAALAEELSPGGLREALEAEAAEGLVTGVDLTGFEGEVRFFVVPPPAPETAGHAAAAGLLLMAEAGQSADGADAAEQRMSTTSVAGARQEQMIGSAKAHAMGGAVLVHRHNGVSVTSILSQLSVGSPAPGGHIPGGGLVGSRGGSFTAAALAATRMASVTAARMLAAQRASASHMRASNASAVSAHPYSRGYPSGLPPQQMGGHGQLQHLQPHNVYWGQQQPYGAQGFALQHYMGGAQAGGPAGGYPYASTAASPRTSRVSLTALANQLNSFTNSVRAGGPPSNAAGPLRSHTHASTTPEGTAHGATSAQAALQQQQANGQQHSQQLYQMPGGHLVPPASQPVSMHLPPGTTPIPISYHYASPGNRTSLGTPALYRGVDSALHPPSLPIPMPGSLPGGQAARGYSRAVAAGSHMAAVMSRGGTATNIPMHPVGSLGSTASATPGLGALAAALRQSASNVLTKLRPSSQGWSLQAEAESTRTTAGTRQYQAPPSTRSSLGSIILGAFSHKSARPSTSSMQYGASPYTHGTASHRGSCSSVSGARGTATVQGSASEAAHLAAVMSRGGKQHKESSTHLQLQERRSADHARRHAVPGISATADRLPPGTATGSLHQPPVPPQPLGPGSRSGAGTAKHSTPLASRTSWDAGSHGKARTSPASSAARAALAPAAGYSAEGPNNRSGDGGDQELVPLPSLAAAGIPGMHPTASDAGAAGEAADEAGSGSTSSSAGPFRVAVGRTSSISGATRPAAGVRAGRLNSLRRNMMKQSVQRQQQHQLSTAFPRRGSAVGGSGPQHTAALASPAHQGAVPQLDAAAAGAQPGLHMLPLMPQGTHPSVLAPMPYGGIGMNAWSLFPPGGAAMAGHAGGPGAASAAPSAHQQQHLMQMPHFLHPLLAPHHLAAITEADEAASGTSSPAVRSTTASAAATLAALQRVASSHGGWAGSDGSGAGLLSRSGSANGAAAGAPASGASATRMAGSGGNIPSPLSLSGRLGAAAAAAAIAATQGASPAPAQLPPALLPPTLLPVVPLEGSSMGGAALPALYALRAGGLSDAGIAADPNVAAAVATAWAQQDVALAAERLRILSLAASFGGGTSSFGGSGGGSSIAAAAAAAVAASPGVPAAAMQHNAGPVQPVSGAASVADTVSVAADSTEQASAPAPTLAPPVGLMANMTDDQLRSMSDWLASELLKRSQERRQGDRSRPD